MNVNRLKQIVWLFAALYPLLEVAHGNAAPVDEQAPVGYFAEGYQEVLNDQSSNYTNRFHVRVYNDGRWSIHITDDNDRWPVYPGFKMPKHVPVDIIMTYDGTDTYYVRDVKETDWANNATNYVPFASYVSTGALPLAPGYSNDGRGVIWFVFAGGSYLNTLGTNTFPLPWKSARKSLFAYGFRVKAQQSSQKPFTISSAEFIRDTALDLSEEEEFSRPLLDMPTSMEQVKDFRNQLKLRNRFWKNAETACRYSVSLMTNVAGMDIPLKCSLERMSHISTNALTQHTLVVTNLGTFSDNILPLPALPYERIVEDSRFRYRDDKLTKEKITYSIGGGTAKWLKTNDARLQQQFRDSIPMSRIYSYKKELIKRCGIIVFIFVSIVVIPCYAYRSSIKKSK